MMGDNLQGPSGGEADGDGDQPDEFTKRMEQAPEMPSSSLSPTTEAHIRSAMQFLRDDRSGFESGSGLRAFLPDDGAINRMDQGWMGGARDLVDPTKPSPWYSNPPSREASPGDDPGMVLTPGKRAQAVDPNMEEHAYPRLDRNSGIAHEYYANQDSNTIAQRGIPHFDEGGTAHKPIGFLGDPLPTPQERRQEHSPVQGMDPHTADDVATQLKTFYNWLTMGPPPAAAAPSSAPQMPPDIQHGKQHFGRAGRVQSYSYPDYSGPPSYQFGTRAGKAPTYQYGPPAAPPARGIVTPPNPGPRSVWAPQPPGGPQPSPPGPLHITNSDGQEFPSSTTRINSTAPPSSNLPQDEGSSPWDAGNPDAKPSYGSGGVSAPLPEDPIAWQHEREAAALPRVPMSGENGPFAKPPGEETYKGVMPSWWHALLAPDFWAGLTHTGAGAGESAAQDAGQALLNAGKRPFVPIPPVPPRPPIPGATAKTLAGWARPLPPRGATMGRPSLPSLVDGPGEGLPGKARGGQVAPGLRMPAKASHGDPAVLEAAIMHFLPAVLAAMGHHHLMGKKK